MQRPVPEPKPCFFIGSSRKDLVAFPPEVRADIGLALFDAQRGREPASAKVLKGFGGRGVLELIEDFDGNKYRAVYTVRFAGAVYVLHAFQKKSKSGIATARHDLELVKKRLRDAEAEYRSRIAARR